MKSERRHKLQENALAHSLENLPKMGRESGSKLLLGIVTVLLVIVLIRYYLNSREHKKEMIATELGDARYYLDDLNGGHNSQRLAEPTPKECKDLLDNIEKKVGEVQAEATNVASLAQAKNIQADAYVHVAELGNPPEATTRPDLALPKSPQDLLDDAARMYQEVLDAKEGLPASEAADAHFGLATIYEDRGDWDKARGQYEAVAKDPGMPKFFTDNAALHLQMLDTISKPFIVGKLGPTTSPATGPATVPAVGLTSAAALPGSPSTVPVAPLGTPTTSPAAGSTSAPATVPATPLAPPLTVPTSGVIGTHDDLLGP